MNLGSGGIRPPPPPYGVGGGAYKGKAGVGLLEKAGGWPAEGGAS